MLAERVKTWTEEWKQEDESKVLRRQLTLRFGPLLSWAEQRLSQASEAELECWTDRVLDAQALDANFADQN